MQLKSKSGNISRRKSGFLTQLLGDFRMQKMYGISPIYFLITIIYILILWFISVPDITQFTVLLIVTDPVILGVLFITVLVFFEKSENVLAALVCTPLKVRDYLLAKVASLTFISLITSILIVLIPYGIHEGHLADINFLWLILGVGLSSADVTLFGFAFGARFKTFNEYMLGLLIVMIPLLAPAFVYLGLVSSPLFYIFPSQACFILVDAAFHPHPTWEYLYSIFYLGALLKFSWWWAEKRFERYIIQKSASEEITYA
jgi:fluoroquinolone transport system permease protein